MLVVGGSVSAHQRITYVTYELGGGSDEGFLSRNTKGMYTKIRPLSCRHLVGLDAWMF